MLHVPRVISLVSFAVLFLLALTWFVTRDMAPSIHVRWRDGLSVEQQRTLERQFALERPEHLEKQSWGYDLVDTSTGNVRALVEHPDVDDTHEIDREAFVVRPQAPRGRTGIWWVHRLGFRFLPGLMPGVVGALFVTWVASTWVSLRKARRSSA